MLVTEVKRETLSHTERIVGRLQPAVQTRLRFEFEGQVAKRKLEPGLRVKQGQVLLQLDDADLRDVETDSLDLYVRVRGDVVVNPQLGQTVSVNIYNSRQQGRLIALQADPNPTTNGLW